jgi:hypothetical protein
MKHERIDSSDFQRIVAELGGDEAVKASAREHKAFQRPRGVRSARDLLRLALMYATEGLSLRVGAAVACDSGLADISNVALLHRVAGSADWLEALCGQLLRRAALATAQPRADGSAEPPLGQPINIIDGSLIKAPSGAAYRLHLSWNAQHQRIAAAVITTTKEGERLDRLATPAGALCIADRGFPTPDGLRRTREAGADVLVRLTWNSLRLTDANGHALDWLALSAQAARDGGLDMPVQVRKPRGRFEPMAMRLVMIPKPDEAAAATRKKAERASRKDQRRRIDPRTLACAGHLMLLTSLPASAHSARQIAALYRMRWQIELAFKRMKSQLHIDRLPAKDPNLARAWLHAHLLAALLAEDAIAACGAFSP